MSNRHERAHNFRYTQLARTRPEPGRRYTLHNITQRVPNRPGPGRRYTLHNVTQRAPGQVAGTHYTT